MGMGTGPNQVLTDTSTLLQLVLIGSINGPVMDGPKDTTTIIAKNDYTYAT